MYVAARAPRPAFITLVGRRSAALQRLIQFHHPREDRHRPPEASGRVRTLFHEVQRIGGQIDELLAALWQAGGSDLHADRRSAADDEGRRRAPPRARARTFSSAGDTELLLAEVLTPEQRRRLGRRARVRLLLLAGVSTPRIRGNAFTQRGLTAVALRMIPREIPSPDDLGLPEVLRDVVAQSPGPDPRDRADRVGQVDDARVRWSNLINEQPGCHIITDRGPDRVCPRPQALGREPARGGRRHARPSAARCASALREDPDVVHVGEMRDLEIDRRSPSPWPRQATSFSQPCTPTTPRRRSRG